MALFLSLGRTRVALVLPYVWWLLRSALACAAASPPSYQLPITCSASILLNSSFLLSFCNPGITIFISVGYACHKTGIMAGPSPCIYTIPSLCTFCISVSCCHILHFLSLSLLPFLCCTWQRQKEAWRHALCTGSTQHTSLNITSTCCGLFMWFTTYAFSAWHFLLLYLLLFSCGLAWAAGMYEKAGWRACHVFVRDRTCMKAGMLFFSMALPN